MLQIRINENGEVLEEVSTLEEAKEIIAKYIEEDDRHGEEYEEGFYEVYNPETGEQLYTNGYRDPDASEYVKLNGDAVLFDACIEMMDDEIREELHKELAPCSKQEFLDAYVKAHVEKYGEEFTII